MNRRIALLVVLALLVPSLSARFASKETRAGSDQLVIEYDEDLAGVASVHVESGVEGIADDYVETAITLEPDAAVDDVTVLILDHPARADRAALAKNFDLRRLRFQYGADQPTLSMKWVGDAVEVEVRTGVEHFHVNELVGPHVQLVLGSDGSELYGVQGDVSGIYRTLAADETMSADDAVWDVTGTRGVTELRFAVEGVPTDAQRAGWDVMVEALGKVPSSAAATRLDVGIADRATVDVYLTGPLTFAQDKDLLWPSITAQLDVLPDLAPDWGYFVRPRHRTARTRRSS